MRIAPRAYPGKAETGFPPARSLNDPASCRSMLRRAKAGSKTIRDNARMRFGALRKVLLALLIATVGTPALALQEVKIGIGFGIAFLPTYLCQELSLVEKQAKAAGLDVKTSYQRFSGSGPMQDAILSGAVDMGPYGVSALLIAWEKAKGSPQQTFAISGVTTLPLVLVTNRAAIKSIKDLKATDRISMPSLVSPQMYLLQMESEKVFGAGQHDKLRSQVVALPHPESLNALLSGSTEVTAYFSSAPFTQAALKDPKVHSILTSSDVMGKSSFLIMGATKRYIDANPKMPDVIAKAMSEAASIIKTDPHKAAEIYLKHEPSKTLDVPTVEAILKQLADDFGSSIHGVQAYADFMGKLGQLKNPPKSWKEIVTPSIANTPST
jgi:NitT/TauT family transport system substrate-binding protein